MPKLTTTTSVMLTPEQRLWLDEESLASNQTIGYILRRCLDEAMEQKPLEEYLVKDPVTGQWSHWQTGSGKYLRPA